MPTPLTIGSLQFETNLIQGPLAGYSCSAFRELIWDFGGIAYACSEMLSAIDLVQRKQQRIRYVHRADNEQTLCIQLAGNNPEILAAATHRAVNDYQADLVDLNCGCPKPKIRRKGYGTKLTESPTLLHECVSAMRKATTKPITVKIRLHKDLALDREQIAAITAANADAIIIHPRHWQDDYDVACDWSYVAECIADCKIPVIANGDVATIEHVNTIKEQSGCAGIMVSRASTGKPWLFKSLSDKTFQCPSAHDIGLLLKKHVDRLMSLENERSALLQARGFSKYYAKAINLNQNNYNKIHQVCCYNEFISIIDSLFIEQPS